MLLAAESHKLLETFLREHFQDRALQLPPLRLYDGRVARLLTRSFHLGAITFGRRIFILSDYLERDRGGRLCVPGWLAAHEATHVLQYERAGFVGFLLLYLSGYWRALRVQKRWNSAAHMAAYLAIKEELEAREAEVAFPAWSKERQALSKEDKDQSLESHLAT